MIQRQQQTLAQRRLLAGQERHLLLQRHPVLAPLFLLGSALVLGYVSFSTNSLFPLLVLLGASPTLICLLLAFVLGTCGALVGIIGFLELVDRFCRHTLLMPTKSKERGYDSN